MKKMMCFTAIFTATLLFSQVVVGGSTGTASNNTSVLLDFPDGKNVGLILPYVQTLPIGSGLVGGTILVDATDPAKAKVIFYNGSSWVDLSNGHAANIVSAVDAQDDASHNPIPDGATQGVIIGDKTSPANGVLILESATKAMILPQVISTDVIVDPSPGMMVYINKAGAKRLAVFNGEGWTYWKP